MSNALILFATRHGQTERIALHIAKVLADGGMNVDLIDLGRMRSSPALDGYPLVVVAGAIHFGRHPRVLERFVTRNRAALDAVEAVLVSVSNASISPEGEKEAERYVTELTKRTGWTPRRTLLAAGAIRYTRYNVFLRWLMRRIAVTHGRGADTARRAASIAPSM